MVEEFWNRSQKSELEWWRKDSTKGQVGERAEANEQYAAIVGRHRPFMPGDRVLEIGCGPAGAITFVDDRCERYGLDPLIDEYRKIYDLSPNVNYSSHMGEKLDFDDSFFHVVMCIDVLDHTRNPHAVLDEVRRVLSPKGLFLLSVDVFSGFRFHRKRFKRWVRVTRGRSVKHPHTFRVRDITRAVSDRGFARLEDGLSGPRRRPRLLQVLQKKGL